MPHLKIRIGSSEVLVIGTAHISEQSVKDVTAAFQNFNPDIVCVELCKSRYEALRNRDRWRKLDLSQVIKEKKLGLLASTLILSSFQKKIGESTGIKPGAEMICALSMAEESGKQIVLADRNIRTTLIRAWNQVGFFSRLWLVSTLASSLLVREDIVPEDIERLKNEDVLTDLFSNLPARYNSIKEVIIDERDVYISEKIREAASAKTTAKSRQKKRRILAVVGAGHLAGISKNLKSTRKHNILRLDELPPKRRMKNIISWVLLSTFALLIGYFIGEHQPENIWKLLYLWIICRSVGSAGGAIIARAHPVTVIVTALIAPFSIFLFGSRLWMYSALTELWFRKPRVEDFENIAGDTDSFKKLIKSFYANRVLKLFWIIFLVSLGLTLGYFAWGFEFLRGLL